MIELEGMIEDIIRDKDPHDFCEMCSHRLSIIRSDNVISIECPGCNASAVEIILSRINNLEKYLKDGEVRCPSCKGLGVKEIPLDSHMRHFKTNSIHLTCNKCNGAGYIEWIDNVTKNHLEVNSLDGDGVYTTAETSSHSYRKVGGGTMGG